MKFKVGDEIFNKATNAFGIVTKVTTEVVLVKYKNGRTRSYTTCGTLLSTSAYEVIEKTTKLSKILRKA